MRTAMHHAWQPTHVYDYREEVVATPPVLQSAMVYQTRAATPYAPDFGMQKGCNMKAPLCNPPPLQYAQTKYQRHDVIDGATAGINGRALRGGSTGFSAAAPASLRLPGQTRAYGSLNAPTRVALPTASQAVPGSSRAPTPAQSTAALPMSTSPATGRAPALASAPASLIAPGPAYSPAPVGASPISPNPVTPPRAPRKKEEQASDVSSYNGSTGRKPAMQPLKENDVKTTISEQQQLMEKLCATFSKLEEHVARLKAPMQSDVKPASDVSPEHTSTSTLSRAPAALPAPGPVKGLQQAIEALSKFKQEAATAGSDDGLTDAQRKFLKEFKSSRTKNTLEISDGAPPPYPASVQDSACAPAPASEIEPERATVPEYTSAPGPAPTTPAPALASTPAPAPAGPADEPVPLAPAEAPPPGDEPEAPAPAKVAAPAEEPVPPAPAEAPAPADEPVSQPAPAPAQEPVHAQSSAELEAARMQEFARLQERALAEMPGFVSEPTPASCADPTLLSASAPCATLEELVPAPLAVPEPVDMPAPVSEPTVAPAAALEDACAKLRESAAALTQLASVSDVAPPAPTPAVAEDALALANVFSCQRLCMELEQSVTSGRLAAVLNEIHGQTSASLPEAEAAPACDPASSLKPKPAPLDLSAAPARTVMIDDQPEPISPVSPVSGSDSPYPTRTDSSWSVTSSVWRGDSMSSLPGDDPKVLFKRFLVGSEASETTSLFEDLLCASSSTPCNSEDAEMAPHRRIRELPLQWQAQMLWQLIDAKLASVTPCSGPKLSVIVVGGGPVGLRLAIELKAIGHEVTVLEKRADFSRINRVHLWDWCKSDLKSLGAKVFDPPGRSFGSNPDFCHIGINELQSVLLKFGLMLGVNVLFGSKYEGLKQQGHGNDERWHVQVKTQDGQENMLPYDVLVGADGANSVIAREPDLQQQFEHVDLGCTRQHSAIGIVANFVGTPKPGIRQFSWARQFAEAKFKELQDASGISLENCVYYHSGAQHYVVMTPTKESLIQRKVFKSQDVEELFAAANINKDCLRATASEAAAHFGLPVHCLGFAEMPYDAMVFDFSKMKRARNSCAFLTGSQESAGNGRTSMALLVGDALLEPFWPEGLGIMRGFLSALDAVASVNAWGGTDAERAKKVSADAYTALKMLNGKTAENILQADVSKYAVDLKTRYR
mmetsp:Transcript_104600/g.181710  ORF Transcript_104600/g.181710 Transcript_104600/m.181710 type:complete len:1179 (+) Transcript_104600:98-3634(+)